MEESDWTDDVRYRLMGLIKHLRKVLEFGVDRGTMWGLRSRVTRKTLNAIKANDIARNELKKHIDHLITGEDEFNELAKCCQVFYHFNELDTVRQRMNIVKDPKLRQTAIKQVHETEQIESQFGDRPDLQRVNRLANAINAEIGCNLRIVDLQLLALVLMNYEHATNTDGSRTLWRDKYEAMFGCEPPKNDI